MRCFRDDWLRCRIAFGASVVGGPVDPAPFGDVAPERLVQDRVPPALGRRPRELAVAVGLQNRHNALVK